MSEVDTPDQMISNYMYSINILTGEIINKLEMPAYINCIIFSSNRFESLPVNPRVYSADGRTGNTMKQSGWGFTPGSGAELHFKKPNGDTVIPIHELVSSSGTFIHSYNVPPDAQEGKYQFWAKDVTGKISPTIDFTISK